MQILKEGQVRAKYALPFTQSSRMRTSRTTQPKSLVQHPSLSGLCPGSQCSGKNYAGCVV